MDDGFAKVGISKHPHQEVSLITTAVGMVKAGLGIAVLPNSAAALCNLDGVRVEPISEPKVHRNLGLVFKSVENLSQPAKRLVSFLTQGG
jgi:DNA-binding transcriptional LysR family regulator